MTRPMFQASGEQVIAGILAGDPVALAEATHRSSKKVQQALASVQAPAPVPTPAPAVKAQTAAEKRAKALRKRARAAQQKAMAAAPDGQRVKAGIKAYQAVIHG